MVSVEERRSSESRFFVVSNGDGLIIEVSTWGASLRSCKWRGRELTLGLATEEQYRTRNTPFLAATIGRFANRIAGGVCVVGEHRVSLERRPDAMHHCHGGPQGFHLREWTPEVVRGDLQTGDCRVEVAGVRMRLTSPHGDQGYPGELHATVDLLVSEDGALIFAYRAVSSEPTPVNLTNHAYWNLLGEGNSGGGGLSLALKASGWLETDGGIPTGRFCPLAQASSDLRRGIVLADSFPLGLDRCFVVDPAEVPLSAILNATGSTARWSLRPVAALSAPGELKMEVFSSQPGLQVYTGNALAGEAGRAGPLLPFAGICLETQFFPDSPNQFKANAELGRSLGFRRDEITLWDAICRPGQVWNAMTLHRFISETSCKP